MKLKIFVSLCAIVLCIKFSFSQEIKFTTILSYFKSKDEEYIKDKLKDQKFLISKERKSDVDFFDTRIDASKQPTTSIVSFRAVSILKIGGNIVSLSYATMSNSDFTGKVKEVKQNGFRLASQGGGSQWIYENGTIIIAIEKKSIMVKGKSFIRYEIGISDTD